MANFLLLYSGGKMPESPAEQAAGAERLGDLDGWTGQGIGRRGQSVYTGGKKHCERRKSE